MRQLIGVVLLLALFAGCGGDDSKTGHVPIDQVPAPLLKIAQEQLPEVKFDSARKKANGVYEIRGKGAKGKVREVELSPDGKVIEIE